MHVYSNILDMVGYTPMLEVTHLDTGPCKLFLKLELMNPGGSIKDRIGVSMIEEAVELEIAYAKDCLGFFYQIKFLTNFN